MLRALDERGIRPDLMIGTSIGSLNGAAFATTADAGAVDRLTSINWHRVDALDVPVGDDDKEEMLLLAWEAIDEWIDDHRHDGVAPARAGSST